MAATLAQMKAVEALARTGRFSLAAAELGLSQPTISAQVQAFEQLYRRRVFQRNGHTIRIAAGTEELIAKIRVTLKCLDDVNATIDAEVSLERGVLSLGFSAHRLIMAPLTAFVGRYPGLRIDTRGGPSMELINDVLSGELDLAAVSMSAPHPKLACHEMFSSRVVVYGRKGHPALQGGKLALRELGGEKLVLWNQRSGTRTALEEVARRERVTLNCVLEVATLDVAYASAAANIGLSCAIEGEVQSDANIDVVPLCDPEITIGHYLVCLPECRDHAAIGAFFEIARQHRGKLSGQTP